MLIIFFLFILPGNHIPAFYLIFLVILVILDYPQTNAVDSDFQNPPQNYYISPIRVALYDAYDR